MTEPFGGRRGRQLLRDPRWNKSTAFTAEEREALGLVGLLPEGVESEDRQVQRIVHQLGQAPTALGKYVLLSALHDRNETLFYRVLMSDPAQYMPIVYTPTVGEACEHFDQILRRPRGLYLSANRRGQLAEIMGNWHESDVRFIVVTDGERILGLGDLGANGMGIPIGKLALYTTCAGVPPQLTLPVMLDVGTNNEGLLADPLYLGLRQPRLTGEEYDAFLDEFVTAVQHVFPRACIQFEDFALSHAAPLLARYRDRVCCYNDDIQGTAAVALAGILGALRITGGTLADQRFLFLGAGSAATGIAGLIAKALVEDGVDERIAESHCWLYDVHGLVESSRDDLLEIQRPFAHRHPPSTDFVGPDRRAPPDGVDRRQHRRQGLRPARDRSDGPGQRATDHLPALQPDVARRVHRGGGLPLVRRPGRRRHRQPVRTGDARRHDVRPRSGQQRVHLPGHGPGRSTRPRPAGSPTRCSSRPPGRSPPT